MCNTYRNFLQNYFLEIRNIVQMIFLENLRSKHLPLLKTREPG